ncbi:hypothetical protein ACFU3O_20420 [Streptomyces antibioticus]|uniref:hypothetical protein n=1 Tax=Streptomyces antibioticus TaxID=1890 RepID=UPI0036A2F847
MRARTALTAALLAAALTACGSGGNAQGTAERAADAGTPAAVDCGPDSELSQAEWMANCASESPASTDAQPDTELAVGDAFAYTDGIKITITGFSTVTRFGEYVEKPGPDRTAFRVKWTVSNGTTKPFDLDDFGYNAEGATTGGETESLFTDADSKQMTGRLAPGRTGAFTAEYTIAKSDGKTIVFTMSRMDDAWLQNDSAFLGEDPHWTGDIK